MINLLIRGLFRGNAVEKLQLSREFVFNSVHEWIYVFICHIKSPFRRLMRQHYCAYIVPNSIQTVYRHLSQDKSTNGIIFIILCFSFFCNCIFQQIFIHLIYILRKNIKFTLFCEQIQPLCFVHCNKTQEVDV